MRIVIDVMGSDERPFPDIEGAVQAGRYFHELNGRESDPVTLILVGDQKVIRAELTKWGAQDLPLEIVHASQVIEMKEKASRAARSKPDSSMRVGMEMVGTGKADAFVTAGNTGAALALATVHALRRLPGVRRPALTSLMRVENEKTVVLVDLGANADSRPEWLVQFGVMGSLYAQHVLGQANPRVALLSNGEEEGKGNKLVRDAAGLFPKAGINYMGNVEPRDVLQGAADVVVADGFVGNIMLKSLEAAGDTMFRSLRRELSLNPIRMLGAFLSRPAFVKLYRQVDPFEIGGAPLLGVNGIVIVAHGRTNAKGIKNAILQAHRAARANVISAIQHGMARYAGIAEDEIDEVTVIKRPRRNRLANILRWRFSPLRLRRRGRGRGRRNAGLLNS
ncbi:MAG TPA: phosphate acyltransferase PlsX [Aggregatilineales bacterium]|nr:phosphate acyltransferase PlsX [Anaerolineales bacterium]HRE48281.1 phosphate acyltransferase PlsX [Aggregatilineales bacterium]